MTNQPTPQANRFKFRAWHKKLENMLTVTIIDFQGSKGEDPWFGCVEDIGDGPSYDDPGEPCYGGSLSEVILMQSTGMLDTNGQEIFEGDIVVVTWEASYGTPSSPGYDRGVYIRAVKHEGICGFPSLFDGGDSGLKIGVIGNIYENPALLK